MATGDQSGTWGTTTNTNLELIGQAFGWGTRAIANASTDNITIADGASDADRNMALKLTGGGQACTVTILPNTSSKVWIMENATAATLTFTQGSGANVAILAGETKMIATDGLGSGAVVYDVLTDLNLAGTTKTAALTNAGDMLVGDDLTLNSDSAVLGFGADTDTTLTHTDGTGLTLNSTNKLCFNDASQFIQGASATVLDIAATDTIELTATNIAVVGTMGATGKITADAGIDIDNFNIDGTTIALSSGTMVLDSAGDIVLDADGTAVMFKDAGTEFGRIFNSSSDLVIKSIVSDKDMKFQGNDGGSAITALTLDMSDAGTATFNSHIQMADNKTLRIGSSNNDLKLYHDGTNSHIDNDTGDLNIDVAGNIILDADGGEVKLADGGTTFGSLYKSSNSLVILPNISDGDLLLKGNDGGSVITMLTLDASAAGAATFNNDVTAFSDERLKSNITTIPDALSKVSEMRGVHYVRNETGKDSSGVVAQELQKIAPELVLTADDEMGTLSVNYGNITGYLIEAVKELSARVKELEGK